MTLGQELWGGGDPGLYNNPYKAGLDADINSLRNSNFGAQMAQQATGKISRRFKQRMDLARGSKFQNNAGAMAKLGAMAQEEADEGTTEALTAGARTDMEARRAASGLSLQAAQQDFAINQENHERKDATSFGNSMFGGLLQQGLSFGVGAFTGGVGANLAQGLMGGMGGGYNQNTDKAGGYERGRPYQDYMSGGPNYG